MDKNKVSVRLLGKEYTLVTDQSEAQVKRIAQYADRKMRELSLVSRSPDSVVAVLTCVTLAEELFAAKEENLQLKRENAALIAEKREKAGQIEIVSL